MRIILTILFFSVLSCKAQTNYYVSNSGNDANDGLTTATAWQHLSKVNSSTFNAGDSILLKRGDSWNERLNIASSGNAGSPIVIGAYGSGNKPLITGFQTVTGFTNITGNIWRAAIPSASATLNMVLINGVVAHKGRFPNSTYLTYNTSTSTRVKLVTSLTGTPNYAGAEVVVRTSHWVIDVVKIASQSGGDLNLQDSLTYTPNLGGNGFFIQNDSSLVDTENEFSFNAVTKALIVYSSGSPTVKFSSLDTVVSVNNNSYITFDNLSVQGSNKAAFQFDSLHHVTVQNCTVNYSGAIAFSAQKCSYLTASNDSILNSLSGAIYWRAVNPYTTMIDTCNYATIKNCYIKKTAVIPGMGLNSNGRYMGIYVVGTQPEISNNIIDSTGYVPILFNGINSLIKNNFITNFSFIKDDGGGIYTVVGNYIPADYNDGSIIRGNIVLNGIGNSEGCTGTSYSPGIYLDNATKSIIVDSNFVSNCFGASVFFNGANTITFTDNKIANSIGDVMYVTNANPVSALNLKRNVFYSASTSYTLRISFSDLTESIDSNYYLRPDLEVGLLKMGSTSYSLPAWVSATGYDSHSSGTPSNISSSLIVYNPTATDSAIQLHGKVYVDAKGRVYLNSIRMAPFSSYILFTSSLYSTIKTSKYKFR